MAHYRVSSFVPGLFCLMNVLRVIDVGENISSIPLNAEYLLLYEDPTDSLFMCLLMDIWLFWAVWLSWIGLLWTFLYKPFSSHMFSPLLQKRCQGRITVCDCIIVSTDCIILHFHKQSMCAPHQDWMLPVFLKPTQQTHLYYWNKSSLFLYL